MRGYLYLPEWQQFSRLCGLTYPYQQPLLFQRNPKPIYKFPSPNEIGAIKAWNPDRNALASEKVAIDYIASIQMPDYAERPEWKGTPEASKDFVWTNGLRFLRYYQLKAIESLQKAVRSNLFKSIREMYALTHPGEFTFEYRTGDGTQVQL